MGKRIMKSSKLKYLAYISFIWILLSVITLAQDNSDASSNGKGFLIDEPQQEAAAIIPPAGKTANDPDSELVKARIKDIAVLKGVRKNQLFGVGLVTGLAGTGDDTNSVKFTAQAISNMLNNLGIVADPKDIRVKNFASVMITADLPPFAKPGDTIDVTVSAMGNAKSLVGGTLVLTPLQGADGQIYAVAQGSITLGGYGAGGKTGTSVSKNFLTVGRIPSGAIVEVEVPFTYMEGDTLTYHLRESDFTTAMQVADSINKAIPNTSAIAADPSTIIVKIPYESMSNPVEFISKVEQLEVGVDSVSKVVINEKNGTIIFGGKVKILPVSIAHGNITIAISESYKVSQPKPISTGTTAVTPESKVTVYEGPAEIVPVTSDTLVQTLNKMGASANDIVAIFQAIKAAGALEAELVII
jgi:flagellar P-ring protein precursor FlgI